MKSFAVHFALCFVGSCLAVGSPPQLLIPSFDSNSLSPVSSAATVASATLPELRTMLISNNFAVQNEAAKALITAGDDATISRLVYAMKQGNDVAQNLLKATPSIKMLSYLLEDVAHGSLQSHVGMEFEPVRVAATEISAQALAGVPGLPAETSKWLEYVAHTGGSNYFIVPEKSKSLLDWWAHNGDAVLAGETGKASWLPTKRELSPEVFREWSKANSSKPPPPPPPRLNSPFFLPLPVSEPYANWAARVSDYKKLDLAYSEVDFETGKSVPPKLSAASLSNVGPLPSSASPKKTSLPKDPSASQAQTVVPASNSWFVWLMIIGATSVLLYLSLRARTSGNK